jgi:hypothetical protein
MVRTAVVGMCLTMLTSCSSSSSRHGSPAPTPSATASSVATSTLDTATPVVTATPTPSPTDSGRARVGHAITVMDTGLVGDTTTAKVTVFAVRFNASPVGPNADYVDPPTGGQYVGVDVAATGVRGSYKLNPYSFTLVDKAGHRYTEVDSTLEPIEPAFPISTIKAGETVRGWISFDVPPGKYQVNLASYDGATLGQWS